MDNWNLGQHKTLKIKSSDWNFDSDGDSEKLAADMIGFMLRNRGIGLAANQIDIDKRVFVMGHDSHMDLPKPFAIFNPEIVEVSKSFVLDQEGCLSYPNLWLTIKRPEWVIATYYNERGDLKEIKLDGLASRCFQHEKDHLEGICFVDKVSQMKLQLALKKSRKYNK